MQREYLAVYYDNDTLIDIKHMSTEPVETPSLNLEETLRIDTKSENKMEKDEDTPETTKDLESDDVRSDSKRKQQRDSGDTDGGDANKKDDKADNTQTGIVVNIAYPLVYHLQYPATYE